MQSIVCSCTLKFFPLFLRERNGWHAHVREQRGWNISAGEPEAGEVWGFVICFPFFCWCCLSQGWWGSCSWGITAGTPVLLNHSLAHGFGGPFLFPCSNTAVGFSPLTVSRIQLKGEEQKARIKLALNSIPTGRTPPLPGTPHRDRFGFFCINLNLPGVNKSSVPRPRWLLELHQGTELMCEVGLCNPGCSNPDPSRAGCSPRLSLQCQGKTQFRSLGVGVFMGWMAEGLWTEKTEQNRINRTEQNEQNGAEQNWTEQTEQNRSE